MLYLCCISLCLRIFSLYIAVGLWDTAGQEDYDRLRPLSYANANVFLACFSLLSRTSLKRIENKWIPELRHYGKRIPIILVGCQKDLAGDGERVSESDGRGLV